MSSEKSDSPGPTRKKALSLNDLIPDKTPVDTSLGKIWVRKLSVGDLARLESEIKDRTDKELGEGVLVSQASLSSDKRNNESLPEDVLIQLGEGDVNSLLHAIARGNGIGNFGDSISLEDFGASLREYVSTQALKFSESLGKMRTSLAQQYAFMPDNSLKKLQEQMESVSRLRRVTDPLDSLRDSLGGVGLGSLPKSMESSASLRAAPSPKLPAYTPWEETAPGRAAARSAEISLEASRQMGQLVDVVGGLNQTVVEEVLPSWFQSAKETQAHSNKSLLWAQIAVGASLVASVGLGYWQINVAKEIDKSSSVAQEKIIKNLELQIAGQNKVLELQSMQLEKLSKILNTYEQSTAANEDPKNINKNTDAVEVK